MWKTFWALLSLACFEIQADAWSYADQAAWSGLCKNGTRQSPIKISDENVTNDNGHIRPAKVNYGVLTNYDLVNPGYTFRVVLNSKQQRMNTMESRVGPKKKYCLWQFHWHWGSPKNGNKGSEHVINGKRYAAEMHLVHYNCKYPDAASALASGDGDAISAMGILFGLKKDNNTNPALEAILSHVKSVKFSGETEKNVTVPIDLNTLIPKEFQAAHAVNRRKAEAKKKGKMGSKPMENTFRETQSLNKRTLHKVKTGGQSSYAYDGSLTTPGCYEQVVWTVVDPIAHPMYIGAKQLQNLYSLFFTAKPTS